MPHGRPAKRRRLTPPIDDSKSSETVKASDLFARAADWDLEQEYEQRARNKKSKESTRLPTKTADGTLKRAKVVEVEDADSFLGSGSEEEDDKPTQESTPPTEPEPQVPIKEQILSAKEEIARLATFLNEDPEEHASSFKKLAQIASPESPIAVQKLVLAAQAAVYKDNIPGYRIRSYKDEELGSKISKEIRQTRQYEQALVTGYHAYVKQLASLARNKTGDQEQQSLRSVAVNCVCTLLLSVPHFNFRTELLNVLVHELATRELTSIFTKCTTTLEQFFASDGDGAPSLEAVSLLTKMLKIKDFRVREEVLNTFFHLRLLSELAPPGSSSAEGQNANDASKIHGRKVKLQKSTHMTKKERKLRKERRAVEKDMAEASAVVDHEEREKLQSETLKLVFATYFRILKARTPQLMGAVLEGLARYAHLINQELFGDLLEALKEIVGQADLSLDDELEMADEEAEPDLQTTRNLTRESLLATQTAFTLLSGQDLSNKATSSLNLDLSFFTANTYRSLYPLSMDADLELGPKSIRLDDPHSSSSNQKPTNQRINISTPILLLTRTLRAILLPSSSSTIPTKTVQAYFKRLLTSSLQTPEKSTLSLLTLLTTILQKSANAKRLEGLWYSEERTGDGVFRGGSESIEGTNVLGLGGGVFELELLKRHFCPGVREGVGRIEGVVQGLGRENK